MAKSLTIFPGGFKTLRTLPGLPELLKTDPDAVVNLPAGPAVLSIDLGEPMRDLEVSFAPVRWNADLAAWLPTTNLMSDYALLFPKSDAAQVLVLRAQDPASQAGRKEFSFRLSLPGAYAVVAFVDREEDLPANLRATLAAGPAMGGGGSGGSVGGATFEAWTTVDGRNAAASVDGVLKTWAAGGDLIYSGPPLRLPRAGNLALAFDGAWDADGVMARGWRFGSEVKELFPPQPGKTVQGSVVFDAGPGIRLEKVKLGTAGAVSVGMGNKIGLGAALSGSSVLLLADDTIVKVADMKLDYPASAIELNPAIGFDGKRQYRAIY